MRNPPAAKPASRRYRGRPTDELREDRRRRLLTAGLRLITRHGYASLSVERICSAARVSTRHFYEHFDNREALLTALFDAFMEETRSAVAAGFADPAPDAQTRALNGLRAFARFCLGHPDRARLAFIETVGVSPAMERHRRDAIGAFVALIAEAAEDLVEAGLLPAADYRLAALALVGATHELIVEWLSGRTALDRHAMEWQIVIIYASIIEGARVLAQARRRRKTRPAPRSEPRSRDEF